MEASGGDKMQQRAHILKKLSSNTTAEKVIEGLNLTGKNAIVTGSSSGLGLETARVLLMAGANVYAIVFNCDNVIWMKCLYNGGGTQVLCCSEC